MRRTAGAASRRAALPIATLAERAHPADPRRQSHPGPVLLERAGDGAAHLLVALGDGGGRGGEVGRRPPRRQLLAVRLQKRLRHHRQPPALPRDVVDGARRRAAAAVGLAAVVLGQPQRVEVGARERGHRGAEPLAANFGRRTAHQPARALGRRLARVGLASDVVDALGGTPSAVPSASASACWTACARASAAPPRRWLVAWHV